MDSILEPAGIVAVVMAVGLVAPYLSDKLGYPVVASMTLVGILLGPELIGFLEPGILLQLLGSLGWSTPFLTPARK
jgi:Kef-type K+ transport system membrane component KefB